MRRSRTLIVAPFMVVVVFALRPSRGVVLGTLGVSPFCLVVSELVEKNRLISYPGIVEPAGLQLPLSEFSRNQTRLE